MNAIVDKAPEAKETECYEKESVSPAIVVWNFCGRMDVLPVTRFSRLYAVQKNNWCKRK